MYNFVAERCDSATIASRDPTSRTIYFRQIGSIRRSGLLNVVPPIPRPFIRYRLSRLSTCTVRHLIVKHLLLFKCDSDCIPSTLSSLRTFLSHAARAVRIAVKRFRNNHRPITVHCQTELKSMHANVCLQTQKGLRTRH